MDFNHLQIFCAVVEAGSILRLHATLCYATGNQS